MNLDLESLFRLFAYTARHFGNALLAFLQRDSFLYWPFIVSAIAIAAAVAIISPAAEPQTRSRWQRIADHCSRSTWWHTSARADYALYIANALLLPLIFAVFLFGENDVFQRISSVFPKATNDGSTLQIGGIGARIAYTALFFVAYDFGRFVAHSMLHDIALLWEFHKVHHSAEKLNPLTTFRVHPVDLLVMSWVPALTTGGVTWAFNYFSDAYVGIYTFLGIHVLIFAFNLIALLRHSHVWLTYGPTLGKWLISPAHHQLHHSYEPRHLGCNRGFDLAIWDRLYGTLYVPVKPESFRMGLGDGTDGEWHSVTRLYLWPFLNLGKRALHAAARLARY